jgi:hypothetical protein
MTARCKKTGVEKFYSFDQVVFDKVLVNPDLTMKGKVLMPFKSTVTGNYDHRLYDFEGTIVNTLINIQIGEAKWSWSFERVK